MGIVYRKDRKYWEARVYVHGRQYCIGSFKTEKLAQVASDEVYIEWYGTINAKLIAGISRTTHGKSHSREYKSWQSMRERCRNEKAVGYKYYGGRGITVCDEWLESFEAFFKDMGERPKGFTLDRVKVNKGYSKENCRWASQITQNRNKRIKSEYGCSGIERMGSKFYVRISCISTRVNIGSFPTLEQAVKARKDAELKHWS